MENSPLAKHLFELYAERPTRVLYHYTSLSGLMGIIESKGLYATDIRFFNDAAEMAHTAHLIQEEIAIRMERPSSDHKLLEQLRRWVNDRLTNGHMQFVASFTANGSILSQWRGYCPRGQGVSLGFHQEALRDTAIAQSYQLGRCRYDSKEQKTIVSSIVETIQLLAGELGEVRDLSLRHPHETYFHVFEAVEEDLLRVAALLKHPSFHEEEEWRAVSPIEANYVSAPIRYREGRSMLLPYMKFALPRSRDDSLAIEHVYLGPTPNVNHSMTSLSRYLSKYEANPSRGLTYCGIPYRDW